MPPSGARFGEKLRQIVNASPFHALRTVIDALDLNHPWGRRVIETTHRFDSRARTRLCARRGRTPRRHSRKSEPSARLPPQVNKSRRRICHRVEGVVQASL